MKTYFTIAIAMFTTIFIDAQANLFNEAYRWNKFIDKVNSPKGDQLQYGDIEGSAYFAKTFLSANIENATSLIKTRYNIYTDTVELLNEDDIFELPKSQKYGRISFLAPKAVLVYITEGNIPMGYYFELATGKYGLYKKMKVEFREGAKAVNSFTPAIAPSFVNANPIYYIKTNSEYIEIPKKVKDLADSVPDQKNAILEFDKKNKLKLKDEADLVKLVNLLNSSI